jgi:hypothetical protein
MGAVQWTPLYAEAADRILGDVGLRDSNMVERSNSGLTRSRECRPDRCSAWFRRYFDPAPEMMPPFPSECSEKYITFIPLFTGSQVNASSLSVLEVHELDILSRMPMWGMWPAATRTSSRVLTASPI